MWMDSKKPWRILTLFKKEFQVVDYLFALALLTSHVNQLNCRTFRCIVIRFNTQRYISLDNAKVFKKFSLGLFFCVCGETLFCKRTQDLFGSALKMVLQQIQVDDQYYIGAINYKLTLLEKKCPSRLQQLWKELENHISVPYQYIFLCW